MSIGTSIVIAVAWAQVLVALSVRDVTNKGLNMTVRRAWVLTAIALLWELFVIIGGTL